MASHEKKYPTIDPDSPYSYSNGGFTNQEVQKIPGYRFRGYSADGALSLATEAAFPAVSTTKPRSVQSQASSPPKRECEYKAVMSDDDYRACNLTPPTVR